MHLRFFLLVLVVLLPTFLPADQLPFEELLKQEKDQMKSENEAILVCAGRVGSADAIFFIEWSKDGDSVAGSYYVPARGKNVTYVLKGKNPKSGVLEFEEFLADGKGELVENASCTLKKRTKGKEIVWEGEKVYPNGRAVMISFSREK